MRLSEARQHVIDCAIGVDNVNSLRANALVQDLCFRTDYEHSMGHALDRLRAAIDAMRDAEHAFLGKPSPMGEWLR